MKQLQAMGVEHSLKGSIDSLRAEICKRNEVLSKLELNESRLMARVEHLFTEAF